MMQPLRCTVFDPLLQGRENNLSMVHGKVTAKQRCSFTAKILFEHHNQHANEALC